MSDFARLAVRNPQPFDIVGDSFVLCGLGSAFEGVVGSARLADHNGTVLAEISPIFVPGSGSLFTLFDVAVTYGVPASYAGFSKHRVVGGDTLFGIAENSYGAGNLWPRLFTANRDRISDPDLIRVGQVLRIPFEGP
jgi:nucleoid-associated protein YgaU